MKKILVLANCLMMSILLFAQQRSVKIDFESGSFANNPRIPFDQPFSIQGDLGKDIELVKVNISYAGKDYSLQSFIWNRVESNQSGTFSIVVPPILKSSTKYDFNVMAYKSMSDEDKEALLQTVRNRVRFLLMNNIYFNGNNVIINRPKEVFRQLEQLIKESLGYCESKNSIAVQTPSNLVLEELKKQSRFSFSQFFKGKDIIEKDSIASELVSEQTEHIVDLISADLAPFFNSQLVYQYRIVKVTSVETDREPFTLPVNIGMYAWDKTANINNVSVKNINFTPGVGLTIPFNNKSKFAYRKRMFDEFGWSAGVLLRPITDAHGTEFVTPGVNLPIYTGLGFRAFKALRFNAGVIVLGEKGTTTGFNNLSILPMIGLALELNLWMGVKK